jgi:hypothetical protein
MRYGIDPDSVTNIVAFVLDQPEDTNAVNKHSDVGIVIHLSNLTEINRTVLRQYLKAALLRKEEE